MSVMTVSKNESLSVHNDALVSLLCVFSVCERACSCRKGFSPSIRWAPVIHLGCQAWRLTPLPTEPSHWPRTMRCGQGVPFQDFWREQLSEERVLRICCLGQIVFPATFSVSLTRGFLLSFVTTTFVMEAMAAANAQLRWKRMEIHKVCALPSSSGGASKAVSAGFSPGPQLSR